MVAHRPSVIDLECELSSRSAAEKPTSLIVDFLLVIDVTAGSADHRANRRALSATDQRASQGADASASRRAPDRFTPRVLAVVIVVVIAAVAIASVIVVVVPGRGKTTPAASVLRHRAWSGGGD